MGPDRQLDRDRAAASFRAARPPACPRLRLGAKLRWVSLRRSPDCFKRIRSRGRKRGRERFLPLIERTFARI
jgi:hypothetical protein